jgi:phytoene desaturase
MTIASFDRANTAPPRQQSQEGAGDRRPHAIVIGSGFGGLAAAIRLGARGYRVTVLERRDQAGGRAYVYRDQGFVFDAGPTVVTAPFLFDELWELCGKRMADHIDMRPVTPFYRIRFDNGYVFDYTGDADAMRAQIRDIAPRDVAGYDRFVAESEKIFRVGFEKLAHVPFGSPLDMLKIAPQMVKLKSFLTVHQLVSLYVKDERLRQVLSFHPLLVGGNPYSTTSIYALIAFLERKWGVHFPIGGTGSLVQGLCDLIHGQGGSIRCGAEVEEITCEGKRATGVRLAGGEVLAADVVVSNADAAYTYRHMVPERLRKHWTNERIEKARYSMSLFVWYFGTRRQYQDVAHHTILLGPRYEGLLDDIFEKHVLPQDFSLYLHRPTATDPSLAPAGSDAFYVLSPVPHLQSGTDWEQAAEPYRRSIEAYLERTVLPGLRDQVVSSRVFTPLDFKTELLSMFGAAFSFQPLLTQSAYFRPHNASEDIDGLFIVGAGTHPGAGLPGVLSSAKVLDTVVPHASEARAWATT